MFRLWKRRHVDIIWGAHQGSGTRGRRGETKREEQSETTAKKK